jgi:hypothetical protein
VKKTGYPVGGNTAWSHGVLKEKKFQITIIEGFRFQVSDLEIWCLEFDIL